MIGRNETLLESVKNELGASGRAAREGSNEVLHRVIVGDVGSAEFWAGMRKEVSGLITISLNFDCHSCSKPSRQNMKVLESI